MPDPYLYPSSSTLKNKLGIKDNGKLSEAENAYTSQRIDELLSNPIKGNFDLNHLKAIHKHIFQDIYSWAGEVRTVDIAKGGSLFALPHYIDKEANKLFTSLSEDNHLKGIDKDSLVAKGAHYLGEINALHPFREGNGRAQQVFFTQLISEAGYSIDWRKITKNEMNHSAIASFNGDLEPFKDLLNKVTFPTEQAISIAPRIDINSDSASLHSAAIANLRSNAQALGISSLHTPEELSKLAYWRSLVQEENKDKPEADQARVLSRFDELAKDPEFLRSMEGSPKEKNTNEIQERDSDPELEL